MHVSVGMCMCVHVSVGGMSSCLQRPGMSDAPGVGATGGPELPDMGARNGIPVLWKITICF